MLRSLVYVSRSLVPDTDASSMIADIVAVGSERNAACGVTGALVYSGNHFAQLLEGPDTAVERLLTSIRADGRHTDLLVVRDTEVEERQFDGWGLAYNGRSSFIDKHIAPLVRGDPPANDRARQSEVTSLIRMMTEFVKDD